MNQILLIVFMLICLETKTVDDNLDRLRQYIAQNPRNAFGLLSNRTNLFSESVQSTYDSLRPDIKKLYTDISEISPSTRVFLADTLFLTMQKESLSPENFQSSLQKKLDDTLTHANANASYYEFAVHYHLLHRELIDQGRLYSDMQNYHANLVNLESTLKG